MPLVRMTKSVRDQRLSRVMLYGPPNSLKTTACIMTSVYPAVILSVPGEHGFGTIPDNVPGLIPLVWQGDAAKPQTSESVKREVETEVKRVIAGEYDGEYGKVRTLIIDGYHKMYQVYLNVATAKGRTSRLSCMPGHTGCRMRSLTCAWTVLSST